MKRVFGRVSTHPTLFNGRPFVESSNSNYLNLPRAVEVFDVLDELAKNNNFRHVQKKLPRLSKEDILACQAYQARFLADTMQDVFERRDRGFFFMLDENMPYLILHSLVKQFGRCSHVDAEGLTGATNDDEKDIWKHLVANGYKAIITRDDDFVNISLRYRKKMIKKYGSIKNCPEHIPVVIHLNPRSYSRDQIATVVKNNAKAIRQFVQENDAVYAKISETSFQKMLPDSDLHQNNDLRFPNEWNKGSKNGPKHN